MDLQFSARSVGFVALMAFVELFAATSARATFGHRRDPDRVRIVSAVDAPDPFSPPGQASKLTVTAAVRKVAGLGARDDDDDDDCDDDRGVRRQHQKVFEVTVRWVIRGRTVIRTIEQSVVVQPPLNFVKLPGARFHGSKKFALIPISLTWDGRTSNGQLAPAGTYRWQAEALFTRTHAHGRFRLEKVLDESDTVRGTVEVLASSPAPTIAITQPGAGALLRSPVVAVAGTVTGRTPLSVKVNGVAAAAGAATFAGSASLVEGANTIVAIVTDGGGRTAQASVQVTKDGQPPQVIVSAPAAGSTAAHNPPQIVIRYSDPAPASGVDTSTLAVQLDGLAVSASAAIGPEQAVFTLAAPLTAGQHVIAASVRDRAGNEGAATSTFTVPAGKPAPPSVGAIPATTNTPVITVGGGKPADTAVLINGAVVVAQNGLVTWSTTRSLLEGTNSLSFQTRGASGLLSDPVVRTVTLDSVPPAAPSVVIPPAVVSTPTITLSGTKPAGTAVVVNGVVVVPANASTSWSVPYVLQPGPNPIVVETQDAAGNRSLTQGGQTAGVASAKPVIGGLNVTPPIVPTGQSAVVSYRLFAPASNADLRVTVSLEDGDRLVRSLFTGVQTGAVSGTAYSLTWDGRDDAGQTVPVNTSYRVVVTAERAVPNGQGPELADANPQQTAVTVIGSQQVLSTDSKLRVIFRPDDARLTVAPVTRLTARQSSALARRYIRLVTKPYRVSVDRPFTSSVVGLFSCEQPVGSLLHAFHWDEAQQDWVAVARSNWNPVQRTLQFAIEGARLLAIGSTNDSEPPAVTAFTTPRGVAAVRVLDRGTGINPAKTRVRCAGADLTRFMRFENLNGTREQVLFVSNPRALTDTLLVYLEDWHGNGRLHRVKGGGR